MKEKFNIVFPIVNCMLVISTLTFKSIDYILWILILILNIISLSISLKDDSKIKIGMRIFSGIILILSICCILYKIYEVIYF
ncbi:hypothetical protein [Clostridium sp. D53t1_180928_C8]|uniref:hypothetical protein n=1 Tax=Clostridium sp. D53t1_180928_C8 TaxID=2787101 RepID=UPI0018A980DE|nr:hypothetical protein [Clostridium sp. D53t1_180928_C8]